MELQTFKIFGKILISNKPKVSFIHMNEVAIPRGFFVPEQLSFRWLLDELSNIPIDYSSTFYQRWNDIIKKSRFMLFLDQIKHYSSTYGTEFQGETWIPEREEKIDFPFEQLKVLEEITHDELIEKVKNLAYSNVAVKEDTLDFLEKFKNYIDINKVGIRQLKLRLIDEKYKFSDGQECLSYILWKFFNISLLIKNKETFDLIKSKEYDKKLRKCIQNNEQILSTVFLRNKDLFLTIKSINPGLHQPINHIRKLARINHKPMPKSKWLRLAELSDRERLDLFNSSSIFKLVQIYNALINPTGYYVVRNGKAFYKAKIDRTVLPIIKNELLLTIVSKVPTDKKVQLPKGIELAMPTSEKNFIGDIPLGSYIKCSTNNTVVGIYWKNEWGAKDLDLHAATIEGTLIGWNSNYTDEEEIVFSGDMTNAEPEATELMWFKKKPVDSIVSVSEYSGNPTYKMRVFVAQEQCTDFKKNYMVDPRNIVYQTEIEVENKSDLTIGFFKDNNFVFHSCNTGKGQVPSKWRTPILDFLTSTRYLTVREVLELANVEISDDGVSLNTRGELIEFFS